MRRLRQFGIVLLIAMNVTFLLAQTETFPRWRMVGGTGGVPIEVNSSNAVLMTLTGTAAQADSGTAATLPRYRLAGGTTGNLAEVDSTGHLLITGIADTLTTGTGKQVLQDTPTLIAPLLGTPTSGVLTNATGYPVASLANLGAGAATFLTTPTSANLAAALTNETGSTLAVFSDSPTFSTTASFTGTQPINIGVDSSTYGGFIWSTDTSTWRAGGGAKWNGSTTVATAASASTLWMANGAVVLTGDTGLTPTNTFTPTNRLVISSAGAFTIGDLAATGAATGKTEVCADTNGKLYRSASGYSCETTNTGPGTHMELIYCGQAAENGTIYLSPAAGINGITIGARPELSSATCDALDGATESTQDIIIFPQNAFRVTGMYCMQVGAEVLGGGETIVFTYRANAANVTPSVTCTISAAQTGCASAVVTTTDVAANLPTAMQAVMTSNNTDQDLWCSVSILVQP